MPQVNPSVPLSPLRALASRWWIALVLVVLGAGAGVSAAYATPTDYTAEARIAVGSQSLDARVVAGYSQASQQLAADVSRYVNDLQAQQTLSTVLGERARDVSLVAASPIPSSSVVRVEVTASDRETAVDGAQAMAENLTNTVNATTAGSGADALLQQYTDLSNKTSVAQQALADAKANLDSLTGARASQDELSAARAGVEQASSAVDVLQVQQQAVGQRYRNAISSTPAASGLRIVVPGQIEYTSLSGDVQRNGLAGAVLGLLLALGIAVLLDRRRVARHPSPTPDGPAPVAAGPRSVDVDRDLEATSEKW
ncbi:Wzz/FepE/Etk N-terminal domain-containing protein [Kineococcus sp. DHX-1]|uniref:Wzz/FepE/Etk N-terminal domain-containing protein n=1 Tax=Kineococcus sp. DHX-1 TaxID=3349638 RepID=UPI0036D3A623